MSYLYFWGRPIIQQHKKSQTKSNIHCIETNQPVQQVSCGLQHAFLVTETNQVYGMGSNSHGQCGAGYLKEISILQIQIPTKSKIVSISCGWYHTIILDQMGCVFTAGSGMQGATGQGYKQNSYTFKQIMTGVRKISAGMDHSLVIKGTKVYGWGSNDYGQLGLHTKKNYFAPQQLNIYPCNQLCAGNKYSIFLTVKGVYGCGMNNNYQLGLGHEKIVTYPKAINIDQQIVKIYCGNYSIGRTKSNTWYIWGSGAFGTFKFPTKASFFQGCQKLSLGVSFGMMLKDDKIFVWGSNNFGQLGTQIDYETKDYAYESSNLSDLNLCQFSCGTNFGIGISNEQRTSYTNGDNDQSMQSQSNQQIPHSNIRNRINFPNSNYNKTNLQYKNQSSLTHYNTNHTNSGLFCLDNKNSKMRTVHTDGYQQQKSKYSNLKNFINPQNIESSKMMLNNKKGKSNFVYSNNCGIQRQEEDIIKVKDGKALSQQAVKRKTKPNFAHHNNQSSSSLHHHFKTQQPFVSYAQCHKESHINTNKTGGNNQRIATTNRNIYQKQYSVNKHLVPKSDQNHIHSSQQSQQNNKQNWQNIQKLRKVINKNKQQQNSNNSNTSSRNDQQNITIQKKDQYYYQNKKQFQEYGQNLQKLKRLLQQVRLQKETSSSNEQLQY